MSAGKLIGVGVGPGDPELITLKAVRTIAEADVVAHFAKAGKVSHARTIAAAHLRPEVVELPLAYPVTTELPSCSTAYRDALRDFYDQAAAAIAAHIEAGRVVAVICEGDPLFYGSYMHVHTRLARRFSSEIVAGVTGMSGCWSAAGTPIAQGDDVFAVLPATLPEDELARRLSGSDAAVVQDLGYTYDPVGNITRLEDGALQTVFRGGDRVEPEDHGRARQHAVDGRVEHAQPG